MATSPPFNVMEDQTDEDFFDKLVDDDDFRPTNSDSGPKFTEGSDSDDAKAFANLSIEDAKGGFEGEVEINSVDATAAAGLYDVKVEESNALEAVNSLGSSDELVESNNDGIGSAAVPEAVVGQSSESMISGVKEVGWGSFYADSAENGIDGFGSSSDFFNDFGGISEDLSVKKAENVGNLENVDGGGLDSSFSYQQYQDGAQVYAGLVDSVNEQDLNSRQYWENMYPGWKRDPNTGQWYQVDAFDATTGMQGIVDGALGGEWASAPASDGKTEVNYLQQTSQSVVRTVAETSTIEDASIGVEMKGRLVRV